MAVSAREIFNAMKSHAMGLGVFDQTTTHEPKSAQGGRHFAVWLDEYGPARGKSSLIATTGRLVFMARITQNMLADPQDEIEPEMLLAVDRLIDVYSGDFTLGGLIQEIDLLGETGTPLSWRAGYLPQDGKLYRAIIVTIPAIVNDLYEQEA